jgi:hypothetical protein
VIVRTSQAEARVQATLRRQVEKTEHTGKQKRLPSVQPTLCPAWADALSAWARKLKGLPVWLDVQSEFVSSEHHPGRGRPRKDATAAIQWHIQATVTIKQPQVEQEARRKACFIVATNVLDERNLVFARSGEHL